jgi:hypothetical protein
VLAGQLGCPNCRETYPVVAGTADFAKTAAGAADPAEDADATTLAALLGITEGPAMALMLGSFDAAAAAIAGMIPDLELVVARSEIATPRDVPGVSTLRIADRIPLYDRTMRGVVVARSALHLLAEAARVCAPAARVIVRGAHAEVRAALPALGLQPLSDSADTLVAVRHA